MLVRHPTAKAPISDVIAQLGKVQTRRARGKVVLSLP